MQLPTPHFILSAIFLYFRCNISIFLPICLPILLCPTSPHAGIHLCRLTYAWGSLTKTLAKNSAKSAQCISTEKKLLPACLSKQKKIFLVWCNFCVRVGGRCSGLHAPKVYPRHAKFAVSLSVPLGPFAGSRACPREPPSKLR